MNRTVGIVRDDRYLEHKTGLVHLEHPQRLQTVYRMLDTEFSGPVLNIKAEPAGMDQLELFHTPAHIEKVLKTAEQEFTHLAPDTPVSAKSYLAAWLAVGGCLRALQALLEGRCHAAFALVRPPGHHALPDRATGFCIFNNLAVAARQALKVYGLRRILVVDWDVHHGNGIQDGFYGEKEVLYFSSHYLMNFPHTGDWEETGAGPGLGYNINLPLPKRTTDEEILHCYRTVLTPVFQRYRPELVMVAAGFDAHQADPLGRMSLTEKGFGWLTSLLLKLSEENGRPPMLLSLEGGYNVKALAASVHAVLDVLAGNGSSSELPETITPRGAELAERAVRTHAPYGVWADDTVLRKTQGGLYR